MSGGPSSYLLNVQNPFETALQGYQTGASIRGEQQKRQRAQQMQQELQAIAQDPSRLRSEDIFKLQVKYPELGDHFKQSFDQLSESQRQNSISQLTPVYAALRNNSPEKAVEILESQRQAALNSGNEQQAKAIQAKIKEVQFNPDITAFSTGMTLGNLVGADEFKKLNETLSSGGEKVGTYKFDPKVGVLNTTTGEVTTSLEDLGKPTQDPKEKFEQENKLRKDFNAITKDFRAVRDATSRVVSSAKDPSAAGDLALIFNYMKILDPGSVVREGEFANAQNSAAVPERIRAQYNKVISGQRLATGQRKDFLNRAKRLFKSQQGQYRKTSDEYRTLADRYELSPENVVLDLDILEDIEVTPSEAVQAQEFTSIEAAEAANLPIGTEVIIQGRRAIIK